MKILAVIPKGTNSGIRYIAEVEAGEILNLSLFGSLYSEITVTSSGGLTTSRKCDALEVGDEIDPNEALERRAAYAEYINSRAEIEKAMSSLRGAMTKLQNLTAPSKI